MGRFAGLHAWAAPVVALFAVGMHYALNVPGEELLATTKKEQEPPPEVKPRPAPPRTKPKAKAEAPSPEWTPRTAAELDRLRTQFQGTALEDEPQLEAWARKAQAVVGRAVMQARTEAFAGAPEDPRIVAEDARCRTIRCQVVLRSPYPHELRLIVEMLPKVRSDGKPIWASFEAEPVRVAAHDESEVHITVSLASDTIEAKSLSFETGD